MLVYEGQRRYRRQMNTMQTASASAEGIRPGTPWVQNRNRKALIFYHIPKCAGTSFSACLKRNADRHRGIHTCHDWLTLHEEQLKGGFNDVKAITLFGHAFTWHHGHPPDYAKGSRKMLEQILRDHGATDQELVDLWMI